MTDKLPPEPIPGNYYRTRLGEKILYVGPGADDTFIYDKERTLHRFYLPYMSWRSDISRLDVIAPWVDPLPAVDVKSWAIVAKTGPARGAISYVDYDSSVIEHKMVNVYGTERFEVIELKGILPGENPNDN
jgi:hypothetical protein